MAAQLVAPAEVKIATALAILGTASGERIHILANPVSVEDVTGAGDAYWSGLLAGLYQGFSPLTAAKLGQAVAEYKIGFLGPVAKFLPFQHYLQSAENMPISPL